MNNSTRAIQLDRASCQQIGWSFLALTLVFLLSGAA